MNEMRKLIEAIEQINEHEIKSFEGSIDEELLNSMILQVMGKHDVPTSYFDRIKNDVIDDYMDSDISQVTEYDIVEVMDASGIPGELDEDGRTGLDDPVFDVMTQLQRQVTETAHKAQQISSYLKLNHPEAKTEYNVAVDVEMELDILRKRIFDVR